MYQHVLHQITEALCAYRIASRPQPRVKNKYEGRPNTTGHRGVSFKPPRCGNSNPWCARISNPATKRQEYLGMFRTAYAARRAFVKVAKQYGVVL